MCLAKKKVCKLDAEGASLRWLNLQEVEDACRRYSAYAWVAYREPDIFPSVELAQELSRAASERVDAILQQQNAAARQRRRQCRRWQWRQGRQENYMATLSIRIAAGRARTRPATRTAARCVRHKALRLRRR